MPPSLKHWGRFKMKQWPLLRNSNVSWKQCNLDSHLHKHLWQSLNQRQRIIVGLDPVTINSPKVEAVPPSNSKWEQEVVTHAALLRDEVLNIVPGTVNVAQGGAWVRNVKSSEDGEGYNSQRLPLVPDTPVAGGCASLVTFGEHVVSKEVVVSSTPHVKIHPPTVDLSGVSSPETSDKEREIEVEITIRCHQPWLKGFEGGAGAKTLHPLLKIYTRKIHSG